MYGTPTWKDDKNNSVKIIYIPSYWHGLILVKANYFPSEFGF